MDISRNKFSNAVSVIFSVVLVGLFCVLIRNKLGLDNIVSCAIIAAILCGIVACLIFFLNRIVNKFSQGKAINDRLIYNIVIIVISLIFVVIRLLMISNVIEVPMSLGTNYENAVANGGLYLNFATVEGIVSSLISVFVTVLGNTYFPIILVQFILNIISFVLILFGVKNLMGRMASLAACFGLAVGPVFYSSVASDGVENLILLMFGLIVFISSKYKKSMDEYQVKWYFSLFIGLLLGIFGLYHKSLLVLPVIPLVVLWDCNSESTSTKVGNTFAMLLGGLIAFFVPIVIDCFLFGNGGVDGFITMVADSFTSRFGFNFNLAVLERFLAMEWMIIILILCIAYCVLFWKNDDDAGHIMASFAVLILAQMVFTVVGGSVIYPMLTLIALLSVGGYSFINLGYDPNASDVYRIDDDMQPAVVQTIGNKVVASDEEIQKVFAENEEKMKNVNAANDVVETSTKNEDVVAEISNGDDVNDKGEIIENSETAEVTEATNGFESLKITEEVSENVEEVQETFGEKVVEEVIEDVNVDKSDVQEDEYVSGNESKYADPEERKTSDFGMNNTDFASLFSGSSIPPKFARNDYFDYSEETESVEETVEVEEEIEPDVIEEVEGENTPETNEASDKKAYVDTFFSYLYDESVFEQPIEVPEHKEPVEEKYVSNASKFADLELDLGIDAFDYVPDNVEEVSENENQNSDAVSSVDAVVTEEDIVSEESISGEVISEETTLEAEEFTFEEPVESEEVNFEMEEITEPEEVSFEVEEIAEPEEASFEVEEITEPEEVSFEVEEIAEPEEVSFEVEEIAEPEEVNFEVEEIAESEEFSFEIEEISEAEELSFENEEVTEQEKQSIEENVSVIDETNIEEEFDFDEVIPKKDTDYSVNIGWDSIDNSSLEESLDKYEKSVEEEVFKALADFGTIEKEEMSIEEAIERKIRSEEGFSYEEAIERRIEEEEIKEAVGFSLEEAIEKKLVVEESINAVKSRADFSVEEALEHKLALEESLETIDSSDGVSIEDVLSKKFEVEEALNGNIDDGFSVQEAIEQKIDVEREIDDAINKPILDAIDEFEAIDKELLSEENSLLLNEISFEPTQEVVSEEISFEPAQEVVSEEINFAPIEEKVSEEINFAPLEEKVTEEINFTSTEEVVAEEMNFEPVEESNQSEEIASGQQEIVEEFKSIEEQVHEKIETENETEVQKPIEFIENPLPLPKKHVHREMDYGRSVPVNWMHYDVEINSSNNFYDI